MKHLHYIMDTYGLNENIKALKNPVKLTQKEIHFLKELKEDYENKKVFLNHQYPNYMVEIQIEIYNNKWKNLITALSEQEIANLIKVNPELLELFI